MKIVKVINFDFDGNVDYELENYEPKYYHDDNIDYDDDDEDYEEETDEDYDTHDWEFSINLGSKIKEELENDWDEVFDFYDEHGPAGEEDEERLAWYKAQVETMIKIEDDDDKYAFLCDESQNYRHKFNKWLESEVENILKASIN